MPSRRDLLAGLGAGVLATGGVAEFVPLGDVSGWRPTADTWPLARYGPASTAATPATPPSDPTVAWTADAGFASHETSLVVGPDRVFVAGDDLVAFDRNDSTVAWREEGVDAGPVACRDSLYVASPDPPGPADVNGVDAGVFALDPASGDREWSRPLPEAGRSTLQAAGITVADSTVFVGFAGGYAAYGTWRGRRRWLARGVGDEVRFAVADGDLYASDGNALYGFVARDLLDVPLGDGPGVKWRGEAPPSFVEHVAAADGRVFGAGVGLEDGAALVGRETRSGTAAWRAPDPTDGTAAFVRSLAVHDGRVFAGVGYGADADRPTEVLALDAGDGTLLWRTEISPPESLSVAVADDTVLVGLGSDDPAAGAVRALATDTGVERWRVTLPGPVDALAPVAGTAFVARRDGTVHALR